MATGDGLSEARERANRRTKIAVLIGSLEVGGAEQDIVRNVPLLDRDEFEVVVLEFNHAGPLGALLADAGIRVCSRRSATVYAARPHPGPLGEAAERLATLRWIVARLRQERPDVTHSVLPEAYVYQMIGGGLAASHARTVMSRLSLNFYADSQRLIGWLERHLFHPRVAAAVCNAEPIRDELIREGVPQGRIHVIPNGVDATTYFCMPADKRAARSAIGLDQDAFVMLAVGNLHAYKGHGDLIEACALAREALPHGWHLLIAGRDQGGMRAAYERLVRERQLSDQVVFLGARDDVPTLMCAADVFVHPSHHEGLPNAVLEAMASGLPIVATAVGGIRDAVDAGAGERPAAGVLVPPDNPSMLSEALLGLALDHRLRKTLGRQGQARVEAEFSTERSAGAYASLYRSLLV